MKSIKKLLKIVLPVIGGTGVFSYFCLGLLSGLSSFLFINTTTRYIALIIAGKATSFSVDYMIVFASITLLFVWSRRTLSLLIINLSQRIVWNLREHILSLALNANYQQLTTRKARIQAAIVNDVNALTNASTGIIDFFVSVIMAISCFFYLISISLVLFLITFIVSIAGVVVYYLGMKKNIRGLEKARKIETEFQSNLNDILHGYKEIYMDPEKGSYIYNNKILINAEESFQFNISSLTGLINNSITGQLLFYVLISSILLFFSIILKISAGDTVSFVFTLIYLLGSIEAIMVMFPTLMRAKVASNHLLDLGKELEDANFKIALPETCGLKDIFNKITAVQLQFNYAQDAGSFAVGPISFEVRKGETIFIYGGNGSGKTTFIYTLIGLYLPTEGEIRLNDILVQQSNYMEYKRLFAVVFSDFYMFRELLRPGRPDMQKWADYLILFELEGKVTISDEGCFSTVDLSGGQRKRLSLLAALMEEKPILILDEWAADQDPYFRKKFYTEILPKLNREGITIIAITHDDRYYYCADRVFKMEEGQLIEQSAALYGSDPVHAGANILSIPA